MSKQYNIKGDNGLYLVYKPSETINLSNYQTLLIEEYGFFPTTEVKSNSFNLINTKFSLPDKFIGSNRLTDSTIINSQIKKSGVIIPGEVYYTKFKFYFRFYGGDFGTYIMPPLTTTGDTQSFLKRLRVKIYTEIGGTLTQLTLSNLEKYDRNTSAWVATSAADYSGEITSSATDPPYSYSTSDFTGIRLADSNIDLGYQQVTTLFEEWSYSHNGYNFRLDVNMPNFTTKASKTRDYKIIVKYYNIGIATILSEPYRSGETIELASKEFIYNVPYPFDPENPLPPDQSKG